MGSSMPCSVLVEPRIRCGLGQIGALSTDGYDLRAAVAPEAGTRDRWDILLLALTLSPKP